MTTGKLEIAITSPLRKTVTVHADEVELPGAAGVFTVLPGHTPLLTTLTTGQVIAYGADGTEHRFAAHHGFAEILHGRINVLADAVEPADSIDVERAKTAEERARERLRKQDLDLDITRAERALARSLARQQTCAGRDI